MPGAFHDVRRAAYLLILSVIVLLPGLGSSGRLTYHEAFVAQGAREILASGNWGYPTIGGLPWLEKPPLPWWLVSSLAYWTGGVTESVARFPSALAAMMLALGIAALAAHHYGPKIGLVAGAVQVTTVWTVLRGRLAEADILLACLITWAIVAFDRIVTNSVVNSGNSFPKINDHWRLWRWIFFILLGVTALVKGIGFGAVLILVVVLGILIWERDRSLLRRLHLPIGWILALVIGLSWPLFIMTQYGYRPVSLWATHVFDRLLHQQNPGLFASEPWFEYTLGLVGQALPWTPLALVGAWQSLSRLLGQSKASKHTVGAPIPAMVLAGDRLLWAWAIMPVGLLGLAPVKNAHYVIYAQVPWSVWAALALAKVGEQLQLRGYRRGKLIQVGQIMFLTVALSYGLGLWLLGPRFDHRGIEWAFYETAGRQISSDMPLSLLYDDWDRNPYESPFGLIPHDLAVRLFYLARLTCWHIGANSLIAHDCIESRFRSDITALSGNEHALGLDNLSLGVIGRDRDLPVLEQLGDVSIIMRGPRIRRDRMYFLFRVTYRAADIRTVKGLEHRSLY